MRTGPLPHPPQSPQTPIWLRKPKPKPKPDPPKPKPSKLQRTVVRSERRSYEGPITGHDQDRIFYLSTEHGDTMIGFRQKTYEALGSPEHLVITVVQK